MQRIKTYIIHLMFLFISYYANGQRLHVGDRMKLSDWSKLNIPTNKKLIILDFWATTCGSCIESFPRMNKLQKTFEDKLLIIPVDFSESKENAFSRMKNINNRRGKESLEELKIPNPDNAIYSDSIFIKLFPTMTIPQHVWIDSTGQVLAITYGYNANEKSISDYLKSGKISLASKDDSVGYKINKNGFFNTFDKQSFSFYSGFLSGDISFPFADGVYRDSASNVYRRIMAKKTVEQIYVNAFSNINKRAYNRVIWDTRNKDLNKIPSNDDSIDEWNKKYRFSYIFQCPLDENIDNKQPLLWNKLYQDANYFFGLRFGIIGDIEKRTYNALVLRKIKNGLLDTSSTVKEYKYVEDKILQLKAQPFYELTSQLNRLENMQVGTPFIDESSINPRQKINITLTGSIDINNLQSIRQQLQKYGLDIIRAPRTVDVLVIKDKQ